MSFEFQAEKLVYGGEALGHHQGRAVFVPRALPGERLEVEPVRTAKGVVRARPLRILSAAPQRVDSPCPYFGRCGGCQYQHLGPEQQTVSKREILRETLRRIGKIAWESEIPAHAAHAWNYRNQARIKVARQADGTVALGFFEAESHRLFPIDACLILSPRLNALLAELRRSEWSRRLQPCYEIELFADDRDEDVMLTLRSEVEVGEGKALAETCFERLPGVACVTIERRPASGGAERGRAPEVFGKTALTYRVGEFRYQVSPGSFFQASRFLLPELVAAVTSTIPDADHQKSRLPNPESRSLALDLFAGVGLLTLPLARRFGEVIAVEAQAQAAADLARNVEAHGFKNVRTVAQSAFDFLRRFARAEPELAVLDPPRAGVGRRDLELLAALRPLQIVYVSCHPPTLARDLSCLVEFGYEVRSVELFDFFPQTFHIESLIRLTRQDKAH